MDNGTMVFSDMTKAPNSCVVYGKYVQGAELSVDVFVDYNGKEVHNTTLKGSTDSLGVLLKKVSDVVVEHCPVQWWPIQPIEADELGWKPEGFGADGLRSIGLGLSAAMCFFRFAAGVATLSVGA